MAKKNISRPAREVSAATSAGIEHVTHIRELFWQNVLREILTSLSVISSSKAAPVEGAALPAGGDMFDGRLAVFTNLGQRIPIAAVYPLFACGISTSEDSKALSMAVECTVFQIHTPEGEVFTLPLHEIRSFHSLSEELVERLKEASAEQREEDGGEPFGFAAYTSMAKSKSTEEPLSDPGVPETTGPEQEESPAPP